MEFTSLLDAEKFSNTTPMKSMVVSSHAVVFKSFGEMEVTLGHFKEAGTVKRELKTLRVPTYLLRMLLNTITKKPSTYQIFIKLSPELAVSAINDVIHKYPSPLHIMYVEDVLVTIVPQFYTLLPHAFVLKGFINDEVKRTIVSAVMCERTKMMRLVCANGTAFNKSCGGIAILNSEIGILDPKKLSPVSIVANPCVWYSEQQLCAILPQGHYGRVSVKQLYRTQTDVVFDFMVELELRKLQEAVVDKHKMMIVYSLQENELKEVKQAIRAVDPALVKKLKHVFEKSAYDIYERVLVSSKMYAPQFRIKLEMAAGLIYAFTR
jgi:hypothetical protein